MANASVIAQQVVPLPREKDREKLAFILLNVFTPEQCQQWIDLTEQRGYGQALVNVGGGMQVLNTDFRNSDRCIIDDPSMAETLFERIKGFLPPTWKGYRLVGLNERLRFLRYGPGQKFEAHYGKRGSSMLLDPSSLRLDGEYHREDASREQSFIVSDSPVVE